MIDDAKHRNSKYALGVDVSGGVKKDRSVIEIIDLIKWEQVGEWVADNCAPDDLAIKVAEIATYWNMAYVTVESNNYGATTLLALKTIYPLNLIFRSQHESDNIINFGYRTTSKSKPIMIGNLRHELANTFIIRSPLLRSELNTFAESPTGKLEAELGCFDDRVMAMAVGLTGATRAGYLLEHGSFKTAAGEILDPFSLEGIIADLHGRNKDGNTYPIPRQDIGAS